jgi:hypothetical protein
VTEPRTPGSTSTGDSQPLGPEDREHPDRHAQVGSARAEHERQPDPPDGPSGDLESGAWKTEATFGDDAVGPPADPGPAEEDVDPIVHLGE